MSNYSIPANADNKVVAGENAKVMTEEILKGIVESVVKAYIDDVVDTIVYDSRNMKWKDNSDRILGFIYNENNELAA